MTSGCPLGTYITCSFGVLFLSLTLDEETGKGVVGVVGVVAGVRRDAEDERRGLPRSGLDTKAPVWPPPRDVELRRWTRIWFGGPVTVTVGGAEVTGTLRMKVGLGTGAGAGAADVAIGGGRNGAVREVDWG